MTDFVQTYAFANFKIYYKKISVLTFWAVLLCSCTTKEMKESPGTDELAIRNIHAQYIDGWLEMDEEKIMALFEENARLQPNRLPPIEGKVEIRNFWFPKDSSKTVINDFKTEVISLRVIDTLAVTTHRSLLDWTYQKDTIHFGMLQKGINTTVYRRQPDNSWKIWRSMWTDIYAETKDSQ